MVLKQLIVLIMTLTIAVSTYGQTSSLLQPENAGVTRQAADASAYSRTPGVRPLNSDVVSWSMVATDLPEPRKFAKHDLVTIIVREAASASKASDIETKKELSIDGEISSFYDINALLTDLVLKSAAFNQGKPQVGVEFDKEFIGEGAKRDVESFTAKLQAQIIDVKPNGNLVLEARSFIKNSILSNQLFDLRVVREAEGELRKSNRKGIITKILDVLTNI